MSLLINIFILAIVGPVACFVDDFLMRLLSVIAVMVWSMRIGMNLMDWENGENDNE
jgi:hypothetical protein